MPCSQRRIPHRDIPTHLDNHSVSPSPFLLAFFLLAEHRLSQSPGLTLGFEEAENIVFADWALDVADDGLFLSLAHAASSLNSCGRTHSSGIVHELDADLGDTATGASTSKDTCGS
jgi:hypothetical protein